jgi:hypothetical protein
LILQSLIQHMRRIVYCLVVPVVLLSVAATFAQGSAGSRDSIDPGRLSQPGVWRGDIIDPHVNPPGFQPSYITDPGTVRLERYQWQNPDPGKIQNPLVPQMWESTHEIVIKALPGNQNVMPSAVIGQLAPATLDEYRPIAPANTVMNPADPGRAEMLPTLFGRVDPGRMPDRLGGPGGGIGRSAIFHREFETPPSPAGAPSRRAKLGW